MQGFVTCRVGVARRRSTGRRRAGIGVFDEGGRAHGAAGSTEPGPGCGVTYQNGGSQVSFDGDWKRQKLSRSQYDVRFKKDDERYARMLAALERELMRTTTVQRQSPLTEP